MGDLETAERRLDNAYAVNEKEKKLRYKAQNMFINLHQIVPSYQRTTYDDNLLKPSIIGWLMPTY